MKKEQRDDVHFLLYQLGLLQCYQDNERIKELEKKYGFNMLKYQRRHEKLKNLKI